MGLEPVSGDCDLRVERILSLVSVLKRAKLAVFLLFLGE